MASITILIVDDEISLSKSLTFALEEEGFTVYVAPSGREGLDSIARIKPDLILLDLSLPDMSGLDVIERLPEGESRPQIIMISAHGDTRAAVKAVKAGATDYLTKPFDLDDLLHCIKSAIERTKMADEIEFHRRGVLSSGGLIGRSPAIKALDDTIRRIANSSATRILVLGESGTGKTLVAKAIHGGGTRASGPFIEINCASLPEHLIEAELFGAEKGAYTGAHQRRVGLVTLADGGTLFLDEIGELPMPLQAKLLHFLENGQYRPIGGGRAQTADVRVIAATNRDLHNDVEKGVFREDLYYRLNVITLTVPPLRDRGDDIMLLAEHCSQSCAAEENAPPIAFSPASALLLQAFDWPGNVRQLKNLIERLTILYPGRRIEPDQLPPELHVARAPSKSSEPVEPAEVASTEGSISETLLVRERELITSALLATGGHKGKAADRLGISRHAFKRRLQRLGID
ncbi:sigma-54 dependent transcriptional regulator [Paraburkholderia caribensis]|uniref:sigma-54-dependent transcriptional regulator n=1 Tax=Paraburkholderia caribensis TaxID=75105 RepID=UPI0031E2354F